MYCYGGSRSGCNVNRCIAVVAVAECIVYRCIDMVAVALGVMLIGVLIWWQ